MTGNKEAVRTRRMVPEDIPAVIAIADSLRDAEAVVAMQTGRS